MIRPPARSRPALRLLALVLQLLDPLLARSVIAVERALLRHPRAHQAFSSLS
jgi:hypothetical protein